MTQCNFCCLCASDEGVFLDIFTATHRQSGNRSFVKELESCLSFKVKRDSGSSTKICHRCAIELGQCNEFVENYNRVCGVTLKLKKTDLNKSCCLCLTNAANNYLFILAKDFRSKIDPLQKIYECFNKRISRKQAEGRSICLSCRYNLDVLYDLRKLAREVEDKLKKISISKAVIASLPKTETFVVNRKTTRHCQSKIEVGNNSDCDSESGTMARRETRSKKIPNTKSATELKLRTCGQCESSIKGGVDMYRLHSTGLTVCKMCWITMDPFTTNKTTKRKRENQPENKSTRLCAVFLTDILNPDSSKVNVPLKNEKKEVFVISDDSSEIGARSNTRPKRNLPKKRVIEAEDSDDESDISSKSKMKRKIKSDAELEVGTPNKKLKMIKNAEKPASPNLRRSVRYQSSDSESTKGKTKPNNASNKVKNVSKVKNTEPKDKGKKLKPNKIDRKHKEAIAEPDKSKSEDSATSSDGGARQSLRKVRNKVPLILNPKLPDSPKTEKNVKRAKSRTPVLLQNPKVPKNSILQSIGKNQSPKSKPSSKRPKSLMMVNFPFKIKNLYECKICGSGYRNKIVGMKHEMTHFKQAEIRIEKLNITRNFQSAKQTPSKSELPSCSLGSASTNETAPEPEVPTSTSPLGSDEDQDKKSHSKTEDRGYRVRRSKRSTSIQQTEKPADNDNVEDTDTVSSSNGPQVKESTPILKESKIKTAENNTADEVDIKIHDESKVNDTSIAEADSATEINPVDENDIAKKSNGTIVEDKSEEVEKTVNKTEVEEDKADEKSVSPSSQTATSKAVQGERDSGEEMESDVDIRIIDSESSAEDSREQTEKDERDSKTVDDVPVEKNEDNEITSKPTDEDKEEILSKEPETDISSNKFAGNNEGAIVNSNEVSLQNEQQAENVDATSEADQKIEDQVKPTHAVNEVLQEVIDLATAEVQKRSVENEVSLVAETLENISKEIKKTGEENAIENQTLDSFNEGVNEERESCKLNSNPPEDFPTKKVIANM